MRFCVIDAVRVLGHPGAVNGVDRGVHTTFSASHCAPPMSVAPPSPAPVKASVPNARSVKLDQKKEKQQNQVRSSRPLGLAGVGFRYAPIGNRAGLTRLS